MFCYFISKRTKKYENFIKYTYNKLRKHWDAGSWEKKFSFLKKLFGSTGFAPSLSFRFVYGENICLTPVWMWDIKLWRILKFWKSGTKQKRFTASLQEVLRIDLAVRQIKFLKSSLKYATRQPKNKTIFEIIYIKPSQLSFIA